MFRLTSIPVIDQTHLSFQRGQEAWLAEFEKVVGAQTEHFHSLRLTGRQGARCARIAGEGGSLTYLAQIFFCARLDFDFIQ